MHANDVVGGDAGERRDAREIGTEFAAVAHGDPNRRCRGRRGRSGLLRLVRDAFHQRIAVGVQRIEVDGDGAVRRHDVAYAVDARGLDRIRAGNGSRVHAGIDLLLELDDHDRVARGNDAVLAHDSACSSLW